MVKGLIYLAKAGTGKTTFITSGMPTQFKDKNVLYITLYCLHNASHILYNIKYIPYYIVYINIIFFIDCL